MIGPLFLVSTGRTGTQFLATAFKSLGVDAYHEPGPFWLRHLSNAFVSGRVSDDRAQMLLSGVRAAIDGQSSGYVEASCLIYGLVGPLLEVFPSARVVQVVRDPRSYIRSAMDWGVHRLAGRPLNTVPYRRLSPAQSNPLSLRTRVDWFFTPRFERLCWSWAAMNAAMRSQGEGSERFFWVRFEDIFSENAPSLAAIAEGVGLETDVGKLEEMTRHVVNPSRRKRFPSWDEWSPDQLAMLRAVCASEAARYGYDLSSIGSPLSDG